MMPLPPGRDSTTSVWPVFSVTFLLTMRCSVSELAPGVKGITTVIGRGEQLRGSLLHRGAARGQRHEEDDGWSQHLRLPMWNAVLFAAARRT
jgi:hypothetical protein